MCVFGLAATTDEEFVACKILGFGVDAEYLAALNRQDGQFAQLAASL